jgi:hypothetical protein
VFDLHKVPHHKAIEDITQLVCAEVGNKDAGFFRPIVAYHLMVAAATMRTQLRTNDRGDIPVNGYVIALSTSGSGKGHGMGVLENVIFRDFRRTFIDYTLPQLAESAIWKHAMGRAAKNGTEEQFEYDKLNAEYERAGEYLFSFDDAHSSAVKQLREKLLISQAGSLNFIVDEIGSNLDKIAPTMPVFLELYDQGLAKQKLYMNSADRKRTAQIEGKTPTNMILFGTPSKLFNGGNTEDTFYELLETGFARRCIFSLGHPNPAYHDMTAEEQYDAQSDPTKKAELQAWADHLASLADTAKYDQMIEVPRDVGIKLIEYRNWCDERASEMPEHNDIRKAEMAHRYFKTLKLAGALAFVEESPALTEGLLLSAIKLVEESGESFQAILSRERPYMKLARYIAAMGTELTHADLAEELPFYKTGAGPRSELLTMATAWGYKHHIILKRRYMDDVEFFSGEALKKTQLSELHLAHSEDWTQGYSAELAPFDQLDRLVALPDYNWTVHAFKDGHRAGDNVIPGFNLAVFDIDGTVSRDVVHELLEDYTFMTYTTKRHTPAANRFRLILPMNYHLKLDREEYREFMDNMLEWLPFEVDVDAARDIARKWATNEHALIHTNQGEKLLDVLPFVPRTKRNEQRQADLKQQTKELGSLDSLERWFAHRFMDGDRNNAMLKFTLALVDSGMDYIEVENKVFAFNAKLKNKLDKDELRRTVLVTANKRIQDRRAAGI